jgi:hypothetical protein
MDEYIDSFCIRDKSLAILMFRVLKERIELTPYELQQYQQYFYEMMEFVFHLRTRSNYEIAIILKFLDEYDAYIPHNTIMLWAMPDNISDYKESIANYNGILYNLRENTVVKAFLIESCIVDNYVPLHCIDILWNAVNLDTIFFAIHNYQSDDIKISMLENTEDTTKSENVNITMGFNICRVLELGLGRVNTKNGKLIDHIKIFLTNVTNISNIINTPNGCNVKYDIRRILKEPTKYFDEPINFPDEIINMI